MFKHSSGLGITAFRFAICLSHALERTQLVKITVGEFLDDILNTNSMRIIVRWTGTYNFLMHQASAFLNWNFIVYDVQNATYSSHGAPCPARDFFPWLNMRVKVHISVWTIREYPKRYSSYLSDSGHMFLPLSLLAEQVGMSWERCKIRVPSNVRNVKSRKMTTSGEPFKIELISFIKLNKERLKL